MQIFTLGKNGIPLFLFALLLFSGTYSYGQQVDSCGVTDQNLDTPENQQYFCDSQEAELNDLLINGTDITYYSDSSYNNEIVDPSTFLIGGTTYYLIVDGCQTSVTVTIYNQPQILGIDDPQNRRQQTKQASGLSEITICVADENNSDVNVSILRTDEPEDVVVWFYRINLSDPLQRIEDPETTPLIDNAYYYAARENPYPLGAEEGERCLSNLSRILVRLNSVAAPAGESIQEFCAVNDTPTLSDIVASGENQYYATATSVVELSPNTALVDGRTYYVSSVEGGCESAMRLAVTVNFAPEITTQETQRFCESIGEGNNFRTPEVQDLSPAGEWYADDTFTTALDPNTDLVDGEDYYQRGSEECEILVVTADFFPTPNAGSTTQESFCVNEDPVNLVEYIDASILGKPDPNGNGFFTPALSTGTKIFNPADYVPGEYSFTYTVPGNEDCPTDEAVITVTVVPAPNAGAPVDEEICSSELEDASALVSEFSSYLDGRDEGGTFDNNMTPTVEAYDLNQLGAILSNQYSSYTNGVGTYSYTYTVVNETTECTNSASITLEVFQSPDAGESVIINLEERDDSVIDLLAELGNPTGGTWDTGDGTFNPTTDTTPASFTYTVTAGNCTSSATVRIIASQEDCPVVTQQFQRFCASIGDGNNFRRPNVSDLEPVTATWYATAESPEPLSASTLLVDGEDYFAGTSTGDCANRASVTVEIFNTPNAGKTSTTTFCINAEAENLVNRIQPSILGAPDQTGYFSPALSTGNNMFNPADYAPGQYSFRYIVEGNEDCPTDESRITVTVTGLPNAGQSLTIDLNERDDSIIDLRAELGADVGGTWDTGDGFFDPTSDTAGSFTYSITANGCTASATVTILPRDIQVECPEVTDTLQEFCEAATVANLLPVEATWYASVDDMNALPDTTVLVDGESYFAGNASGDCTNRTEVVVDLLDAPNAGAPVDEEICSSELEDIPALVDEFSSYLDGRDEGGTFDNNLTPTVEDYDLNELATALLAQYTTYPNGVGTYSYTYTVTVEGGATECTDSASITLEVLQSPNAGESLTINLEERDDSIIDLLAELGGDTGGTWDTGNGFFDPTSDTTPVSFTYSITADNGCTASAIVRIVDGTQVECPEVTDTVQGFCASIGTGNGFRRPMISDLLPADAVWYATANDTDALASTTELINGEDYFAGNANADCPVRDMVTVNIYTTPNAGKTSTTTFCVNAEAENLVSRIQPSILGAPMQTGYFSPALSTGTNMFNPADYAPGQYSFRYIVEGNEDCPTDESRITVTVTGLPNAGQSLTIDLDDRDDSVIDLLAELGNPTGGTWNTGNGFFDPTTDTAPASFTYTVTAGGCTASATVTILPRDIQVGCPEVTDNLQEFCQGATVANLLPVEATWYASVDDMDALPETTVLVDGASYFAGNASGDCTNRTEVVVDLLDAPNAGAPVAEEICSSELEDIPALVTEFSSFLDGRDEGGTFDNNMTPTVEDYDLNELATALLVQYSSYLNGVGTYSYTYTVTVEGGATECTDSATITLEVLQSPNAGESLTIDLDDRDDSIIDLLAELGNPTGGTWDSGDGFFDPTSDTAPASFTYTVTAGDCTASATVTILPRDSQVECPEVTDTVQGFCASIGTGNGFRRPMISDLLPADAVWYATANDTDALAPGTELIDDEDYYAGNANADCPERDMVTVQIYTTPNAGRTSQTTFCVSEDPENLVDRIESSLLGAPSQDGYFTRNNQRVLDNNMFDPAEFGVGGPYRFTYVVEGNEDCPTDRAVIDVTVTAPEAPAVVTPFEGCPAELPTVANFDITAQDGFNVQVYSDLERTTLLNETDALIDGEDYYVTQMSATGCESEAAMIIVNISGPDVPIVTTPFEACAIDASTVANLGITTDEGFTSLVYTDADLTMVADGTEVLVDGTIYYVTQTNEEGCESEAAEIAVSIYDAPEAPVVTDFSDCVITGAMVSDLNITADEGATINVWADQALTIPVTDNEVLMDGDVYYVTQTSAQGCQSDFEVINVSLEDSNAPTLTSGGDVFCEFGDATIAELAKNVSGSGTITWYTTATGTQTVPSSTVLQNNTTYYAAATDGSCESSQRLAVNVTLEDCGITIPDAFSPNGDRINDTFEVLYLSDEFPNYKMEIYNRWGEPVYIGNSSTGAWDGTSTEGSFGSGVVPAGVYFYILYFNDGETEPTQGRLYLSR